MVLFTYISGKDFKGSVIKVQMAQHKNNYIGGRGGRGGGSGGGGSVRGGGMDRGGRGGGRDNVRVESSGGKHNFIFGGCVHTANYINKVLTGMWFRFWS